MDLLNTKNGEKLGYICLMIGPALIGIAAVLLSYSSETGIDLKMFVAMLLCFAISCYFALQYKINNERMKKAEAFSADLQKDLSVAETGNKPRK